MHHHLDLHSGLRALQQVGVPACAVDEFRRIVWWNEPAAAFFGVGADQAVTREWHTVVRTERGTSCCGVCQARRALLDGEAPGTSDWTVTAGAYDRRVTMVPLPIDGGCGGLVAFLFVDHRQGAGAEKQPIPLHSRVREVGGGRIIGCLTGRERDILACVAEGLDAREISTRLGISHATARNYVQRLLTKLGVRNKAEAVRLAFTHDLLAS